jgi:hypothetical protein
VPGLVSLNGRRQASSDLGRALRRRRRRVVLSPAVPGVPGDRRGERRAGVRRDRRYLPQRGSGPAWAKFAAVCGFEAPADGAPHEPAGLEPPSAQESANGEGMLAHCLRLTTRYRPGLSALRAAAVGGVGWSASPPHRGRARQAARTPLVEFPGENGGLRRRTRAVRANIGQRTHGGRLALQPRRKACPPVTERDCPGRPCSSRHPGLEAHQGCGSSPWSGNTATRVAMIARSTRSAGS